MALGASGALIDALDHRIAVRRRRRGGRWQRYCWPPVRQDDRRGVDAPLLELEFIFEPLIAGYRVRQLEAPGVELEESVGQEPVAVAAPAEREEMDGAGENGEGYDCIAKEALEHNSEN